MYITLILILCVSQQTFSQAQEDEKIKKFVRVEIESFLNRDAKLWEDIWVHDNKITRTNVSANNYDSRSGWKTFGPRMVSFLNSQPKRSQISIETDSFNIRNYKNIAWVEYNLTLIGLGKDSGFKRSTREYRFLVKEKNEWKIVSMLSLEPEMFVLTPKTIEENINIIAFKLLDDKKNEEAVDMFKVNIKLYPESWHAYDSIGEAYATIGKKDEAILSYKKSIALNPNNIIGKAALEKLQLQ